MTRPNLLASLVAAAVASTAAPALAAQVIETYNLEPVTTTYVAPATTYYYVAPARTEPYYNAPLRTGTYSTQPGIREVYEAPASYYTRPGVREAPAIIVEAPTLTRDQAINDDVVDRLASNPKLSGRIGVDTYDRNVELTGVVTNPRQAELAERDARGIAGVRDVQNELRTRLSR